MSKAETPKSLKILLADDHAIVRDGLRRLIEAQPGWQVCGEATNGRDAVAMAEKHHPDVAVLDITMPQLNGLEATRQIRKISPETEVLIFTGIETEELILSVFDAGARGYLIKTEAREQLVAALTALSQRKPYITSQVGEIIFAKFLTGQKSAPGAPIEERGRLTGREREIVQLLAEGKSNKEVASMLGISVKTAETHRAAIMRKLQLQTFSDLVRYAIRNQIIQP
jgi:DNA-binding NarL/FixJ family response regulator